MNATEIKTLKKLADACRKAGIRSFKCKEFEFELTDEVPAQSTRRSKTAHNAPEGVLNDPDKAFESDSLTPEQLLAWSVTDPTGEHSP